MKFFEKILGKQGAELAKKQIICHNKMKTGHRPEKYIADGMEGIEERKPLRIVWSNSGCVALREMESGNCSCGRSSADWRKGAGADRVFLVRGGRVERNWNCVADPLHCVALPQKLRTGQNDRCAVFCVAAGKPEASETVVEFEVLRRNSTEELKQERNKRNFPMR